MMNYEKECLHSKNVKLPYWKLTVWGTSSHTVNFRSNFSCDNRRSEFFLVSVQWRVIALSFLRPKCGKMSMRVHPLYLKPQRRRLAFKFEGSPPFFSSCKRAWIETLWTFYMKHGARYVERRSSHGHVTPWLSKLPCIDIYIYSIF